MNSENELWMLKAEARAYQVLSGGVGIPQLVWFGDEGGFYILVHELLRPSLEDFFNYCDRQFSIKTVLLIADQAISRIRYIHSKGLLHGDIKPDNFLMGIGAKGNILYSIDFGLAKECRSDERSEAGQGLPFGGTRGYASIKSHNGQGEFSLTCISWTCISLLANYRTEQSWGDDLESLGNALICLARGSLPWQDIETETEEERNELIKEKMTSVSVAQLCRGLPGEFATYMRYTRSLGFKDGPDYAHLRRLFRQAFLARGFKYDTIFDWTEKRFREVGGVDS